MTCSYHVVATTKASKTITFFSDKSRGQKLKLHQRVYKMGRSSPETLHVFLIMPLLQTLFTPAVKTDNV